MIRNYCDGCGEEITKKNAAVGGYCCDNRLGGEIEFTGSHGKGVLKVELMHTFDGTSNKGDFCRYCIIDAFKSLDDRPTTVAGATRKRITMKGTRP